MALPKEPRQQMINMMYLVLIALLAMNVSKSLLKAFALVDLSLEKAKTAEEAKVIGSFSRIEAQYERDKEKATVQNIYNSAVRVQEAAKPVKQLLDTLKGQMTKMAGGYEDGGYGVDELLEASNQDFAMQIMDFEGKGPQLRDAINKCRSEWVKILKEFDADSAVNIIDSLPKTINSGDGPLPWHANIFEGMPAAAFMPTLTQLENEIRASEFALLNFLGSKIGIDEIRVDRLAPMVAAETNYLSPNQTYKAEIFVSAWNSTQLPTVYIGAIKSELKTKFLKLDSTTGDFISGKIPAGASTDFWPLASRDVKPLNINSNGRGDLSFNVGTSTGAQTYEGAIRMALPNGDYEWYLFGKSYTVAAKADPVVSATKMNVLYIGVDNPVSVSVPGYQPDKVSAGISQGSLAKKGGGEYIARVRSAGKANISVSVVDKTGKKITMPSTEFRVKRVPDPIIKLGGQYDPGNIPAGTFKAQRGIIPVMDNFDFDLRFNVLEYELIVLIPRADPVSIQVKGPLFDDKVMSLIQGKRVGPGTKVMFMEVKVKGPDGVTRKLPSSAYSLI